MSPIRVLKDVKNLESRSEYGPVQIERKSLVYYMLYYMSMKVPL